MNSIYKIFLPFFIFTSLTHAVEDLGIHGDVFSVEGKSLIDVIEEREKKVDKKKLIKNLNKARRDSLKIDNGLHACLETKQRIYEPTIIMDRDITMPLKNTVLYKKGTKYNILKEQNISFNYYVSFINVDDEIQISLAKQIGKSSYTMAAHGDISKYIDDGQEIKIARRNTELKMFDIKCLPSIVTQQDYKLVINEYNPDDLVEKDSK